MLFNLTDTHNHLDSDISKTGVLVLGDIILDKYLYGDVRRISPEAPVPIVNITRSYDTLGGAGNVANNLSKLGCKVYLSGFIGNDENGVAIQNLLDKVNIDKSGVLFFDNPTITKSRIIATNQQMLRMDFEDTAPIKISLIERLKHWVEKTILEKNIQAVVISDYGKGVCKEEICQFVIKICKNNRISTIIDPKGKEWGKYVGADIITPNVRELSELSLFELENNNDKIVEMGTKVREQFLINHLLVTRSEKGMTLITQDGYYHIPTVSKEVYDVSGAGDTVVSILAAFQSSSLSMLDIIKVANIAAGVVVAKLGTYAITKEDLISALNEKLYVIKSTNKIVDKSNLSQVIQEWKNNNEKIIFTNGCFDILHTGHIEYLERASILGDRLIVALNSDDSVKRLKGSSRPINKQNDRAKLLAALEFVDMVIIFDETTPEELIKQVSPNILVKGGDYKVEDIVGRQYADQVLILPFLEGYSTTNVINKLKI